MSRNYKQLINRFLSDVGGSPMYGVATTYVGMRSRAASAIAPTTLHYVLAESMTV